jgi:hypothetical protein
MAGLQSGAGELIAEMHAAHVNSMPTALRLLANELIGREAIEASNTDVESIRRAALEALRLEAR